MEQAAIYDRLSENLESISQPRGIPFFVKKLLLLYLILLPIQALPKFMGIKDGALVKIVAYSDEITTVLMFFVLFTFIVLRPTVYRINRNVVPTTLFVLFVLSGLLSMGWNLVGPIQGIFGLYNLLKNIIIIYFFASLKWDKKDLFFLIKGILAMTIILAIFGIAGEILALLGRDSHNLVVTEEYRRRWGIYRVHSLLGYGHTNYLAIYAVLSYFLADFAFKRPMILRIIKLLIVILILLTVSNRAWLSLALMFVLTKKRIRSGYILFTLIASTAALFILFIILESRDVMDPEHYLRGFAYLRSFELFINNPVIGVGPGMFGDLSSAIFGSPYYSDWPGYFQDFVSQMGGLDFFWAVILVQVGILGFVIFGMIFARLYRNVDDAVNIYKNKDTVLYKVGGILKNFIIALILLGLGSSLNKPFVAYTYFGLYGIYMSIYAGGAGIIQRRIVRDSKRRT
jgi:hypothetical protein